MNADKAEKALRDFVNTVDATGGVTMDPKGYIVPVADEEWSDLGAAYISACSALGCDPMIR